MRRYGFTLVELVTVIAITGVLAASVTIFLKPVVEGYIAAQRRGDLTDMADTALRRMGLDIRRAVPNSVIPYQSNCIELVPTTAGGRYRMAPDTVNNVGSALDTSTATSSFNVLNPLATTPTQNDWVVVYNVNTVDVYSGADRAQISSVTPTNSLAGQYLVALSPSKQFPSGSPSDSFVTVSSSEQAVVYTCVPGDGNLYRAVVVFSAPLANACSLKAGAVVSSAVVASNVASCAFTYGNTGRTQQNSFVWMNLTLLAAGETATLAYGAHVDNSQ